MRDTQQLICTVLDRAQSRSVSSLHAQSEDSLDPFVGLETAHYRNEYFKQQMSLTFSILPVHACDNVWYNPHLMPDGLLGDYCDGEQYKSHPLFQSDPHALQINLYCDELNRATPLDSIEPSPH